MVREYVQNDRVRKPKASRFGLPVALLILSPAWADPAPRLVPDAGAVRWQQSLLEMATSLRLLCVAAHPDDEDSETLAYYNRRCGVRTSILLGNWGEGGQNEIGPELYAQLGVIRAQETLEAARILGTEVYCLNQKDFGYSKTIEETWEFWDRDSALEDSVRILRSAKPHVVITNHRAGTGHGNHQAMAELIAEAIPLAASSETYIDQIEEGLSPWKVDRFFERRRHHEGKPQEDFDVMVPTGKVDSVRGLSYQDIASEALLRHRSQGIKSVWHLVNSRRKRLPATYYSLIAGEPPLGPLRDLFDGMEGAWWLEGEGEPYMYQGLVSTTPTLEDLRRNGLRDILSALRPDLEKIEQSIGEALEAIKNLPAQLDADPAWEQVPPEKVISGEPIWTPEQLADYGNRVIDRMQILGREQQQLENLLAEIWGLELKIETSDEEPVPGQEIDVTLEISNHGPEEVAVERFGLFLPDGWNYLAGPIFSGPLQPLGAGRAYFKVLVSDEADPSLPETVELYRSARPWKPNVTGQVEVAKGSLSAYLKRTTRIEVAPAWEISVRPVRILIPTSSAEPASFNVEWQANGPRSATAILSATLPDGTTRQATVEPALSSPSSMSLSWEPPPDAKPETQPYSVRLVSGTNTYQATGEFVLVDLKIPDILKVGVVQSYDNTLPAALESLRVSYHLLDEEDLEGGNLSRFDTILIDIRAYLEREDLVRNNSRLLDYVEGGGHLVVCYHKSFDWNDADPPYAPMLLQLSRDRVTQEDAEVTHLQPEYPFFHFPNQIVSADWEGWVQERGVYFPSDYDARYTELVSMADEGGQLLRSGILFAEVGKGTYVYTSLVWYRQLKAVVPGAYRLFANLISYPKREQ